MLENIKKKISNALREGIHLTENISTQFYRVQSPTADAQNELEMGIPSDLNVAAGSELLQKYEEAWKITYEANQANVAGATNVMKTIDILQKRIQLRQVNLNDVMACLSGLPAIEANLKDSLNKFDEIEKLSVAVEAKLSNLINVCEQLEIQEKLIKKELEDKRKEMIELVVAQQKKANEQKEKIIQDEEKLKRFQMERQIAFGEAFESDMEEYKQNGSVPKIELKGARLLTLDEVELDNDGCEGALEEFLND